MLVFCAPTDAKEALKQYPSLVGRFRTTAKCRAEDVLERGVWQYAQSLPRYAKGPPIWCVEDEFGNGFTREVSGPTVGTAHVSTSGYDGVDIARANSLRWYEWP